ncbi:hypothetical protein H5410_005686 [Solanum commersonii]|uniref:Chromo domain-containing protein n=1 Tax=Solanum commersonii TaxID=4109 RepID=A0A9J6A880_SOLCO|nr:hypothetical protein H5410_005686 [Solanum commersonii]
MTQFCYNLHTSSKTEQSPFELVLGMQPMTPLHVATQKSHRICPAAYRYCEREETWRDDSKFEVKIEEILDHQVVGNSKRNTKTEFLVRLTGKAKNDAIWEKSKDMWQFDKQVDDYVKTASTRVLSSTSGDDFICWQNDLKAVERVFYVLAKCVTISFLYLRDEEKSFVFPVNIVQDVHRLGNILGCQTDKLPMEYLGRSLGDIFKLKLAWKILSQSTSCLLFSRASLPEEEIGQDKVKFFVGRQSERALIVMCPYVNFAYEARIQDISEVTDNEDNTFPIGQEVQLQRLINN